MNFDNKYLIAYLCNKNNIEDFMSLLEFYRYLKNIIYKTKDYKLYQIKLKWVMESLIDQKDSSVLEIENVKKVIKKYKLDNHIFLKIIESKNIDMDNFPFQNQQELIHYVENTDGAFWLFSSFILLEQDMLSEEEKEAIVNLGVAFGILENIIFSYYKKSKGIYFFSFSEKTIRKDIKETEVQEIQDLIKYAEGLVKFSEKVSTKKYIKRILLLNNITKNMIKNLRIAKFDTSKSSIGDISKMTYLKIIFRLLINR